MLLDTQISADRTATGGDQEELVDGYIEYQTMRCCRNLMWHGELNTRVHDFERGELTVALAERCQISGAVG